MRGPRRLTARALAPVVHECTLCPHSALSPLRADFHTATVFVLRHMAFHVTPSVSGIPPGHPTHPPAARRPSSEHRAGCARARALPRAAAGKPAKESSPHHRPLLLGDPGAAMPSGAVRRRPAEARPSYRCAHGRGRRRERVGRRTLDGPRASAQTVRSGAKSLPRRPRRSVTSGPGESTEKPAGLEGARGRRKSARTQELAS